MRKRVAVVTGGYSSEREISLKSGTEVYRHIDRSKYDVFLIRIDPEGWFFYPDDGAFIPVSRDDFSFIRRGEKMHMDCVFIAIHGTPGEDGKLQGYFDLINIPYTSCGQTTSCITFNKFFANKIARALGVRTAESRYFWNGAVIDPAEVVASLGLPCFVKPNNGGSSVGVSRVDTIGELEQAVEKAFQQDREIVIEQFIPGFEITCGMIRYKNKYIVFPLTEIISKNTFFDYEAKYTDGMAQEITPARVNDTLRDQCQDLSCFLYKQLNCRGIVRFDFIVSNDELYFLEVNTIPGLTPKSIVPKMARCMGLSLTTLYSMAIEEAMEYKRSEIPDQRR